MSLEIFNNTTPTSWKRRDEDVHWSKRVKTEKILTTEVKLPYKCKDMTVLYNTIEEIVAIERKLLTQLHYTLTKPQQSSSWGVQANQRLKFLPFQTLAIISADRPYFSLPNSRLPRPPSLPHTAPTATLLVHVYWCLIIALLTIN